MLQLSYRIAETFEGENVRVFSGFRTTRESFLLKILWLHLRNNWTRGIHKSFLREILVLYRNAKVFSLESYPLYGTHFSPVPSLITDLVSRMTTEDKIGQIGYDAPGISHLNVPGYQWWVFSSLGGWTNFILKWSTFFSKLLRLLENITLMQ